MPGKLRKIMLGKQAVVDNWSILIEGACDKTEEFYNTVKEFVKESNAPDINMEKVIVRTGEKTGFFGKLIERDYLMFSNEHLKQFKLYVGARGYGNDLNVSWYLTCEPRLFDALLGFTAKTYRTHWTLKMFSQEDLTAYVTLIHRSILKAVENIMKNLGQDPSKIDRKSKGFLGVS